MVGAVVLKIKNAKNRALSAEKIYCRCATKRRSAEEEGEEMNNRLRTSLA